MLDDVIIRHYAGVDPNELTLEQYDGYVVAAYEVMAMQAGVYGPRQDIDSLVRRRNEAEIELDGWINADA